MPKHIMIIISLCTLLGFGGCRPRVIYDANGGDLGTVPVHSKEFEMKGEDGIRVIVQGNPGNLRRRDGWVFLGWSGSPEPDPFRQQYDLRYIKREGRRILLPNRFRRKTLYAVWACFPTREIRYHFVHPAGGRSRILSMNVLDDGPDHFPVSAFGFLSVPDYYLVGWTAEPDGSGARYWAGDDLPSGTEDEDFYSFWVEYGVIGAEDGGGTTVFCQYVDFSGDITAVSYCTLDEVRLFERSGDMSWIHSGTLNAPDGNNEDQFGETFSVDGDYAVIGCRDFEYRDENGEWNPREWGTVYVYHRLPDGTWNEGTRLIPRDPLLESKKPAAVSLNGEYLAAGVVDPNTLDSSFDGAVYVFRRTGPEAWDEGIHLQSPGLKERNFGCDVSVDGDYILVGTSEIGNDQNINGAVYIYRRTGPNEWDDICRLEAPEGAEGSRFGNAVSLDGDTALIGAYRDSKNGYHAGAAYIYRRTGENTWGMEARLDSTGTQDFRLSGSDVSLDNNYAVINAPMEMAGETIGVVYVFRRDSADRWELLYKLSGEKRCTFGSDVSVSGNEVLVGYPNVDGGEAQIIPLPE
jgi:hypothetical protein